MKHTQIISCPYCSSIDLVKNGHRENSSQRWCCNSCRKSFQLNYRYNARKQGVKEQIAEFTLNSSGLHDISRILKISKNTMISELKKIPNLNPYILDVTEHNQQNKLDMSFTISLNLMCFGHLLAISQINDGHGMQQIKIQKLFWPSTMAKERTKFPEALYFALLDSHWHVFYRRLGGGGYKRYLPENRHYTGKDMTWKIEWKNLNFRTHIKRLNRNTICYFGNEQIHDNVTGMYIERYCFKSGKFMSTA
jgi:transposase-like protein